MAQDGLDAFFGYVSHGEACGELREAQGERALLSFEEVS
jgi:hypothetical protein